jgi:hypothetical protein
MEKVISHLIEEGFAESYSSAIAICKVMSEEWFSNICEQLSIDDPRVIRASRKFIKDRGLDFEGGKTGRANTAYAREMQARRTAPTGTTQTSSGSKYSTSGLLNTGKKRTTNLRNVRIADE